MLKERYKHFEIDGVRKSKANVNEKRSKVLFGRRQVIKRRSFPESHPGIRSPIYPPMYSNPKLSSAAMQVWGRKW